MSGSIVRSYSAHTLEATRLLGQQIRAARKERKLTAQEVADRAGISRGLLQRIEKGDLKCAIGATFEVATLLGIGLFDTDTTVLHTASQQLHQRLTLLPQSVRKKARPVRDDF